MKAFCIAILTAWFALLQPIEAKCQSDYLNHLNKIKSLNMKNDYITIEYVGYQDKPQHALFVGDSADACLINNLLFHSIGCRTIAKNKTDIMPFAKILIDECKDYIYSDKIINENIYSDFLVTVSIDKVNTSYLLAYEQDISKNVLCKIYKTYNDSPDENSLTNPYFKQYLMRCMEELYAHHFCN